MGFVREHLMYIEDIDRSGKTMIAERATELPLCIRGGKLDFHSAMVQVSLQRGVNHGSLANEVRRVFGKEGVQSLEGAWKEFQELEAVEAREKRDTEFTRLQDLSDRVAFMYQTVLSWLEPEVNVVWRACNGNTHPLHDELEKRFESMPSGSHGAVSVLHSGRLIKGHDDIHATWAVGDGYVTERTFWLPANYFLSDMDKERIQQACREFNEVAERNGFCIRAFS